LTAPQPMRAALAGVLLFVLGLGIAAGLYQINDTEAGRLQGWRRADGTVVELLKRRTMTGDALMPLIAFTTASGERVSFTADVRNSSPYYVNSPVKVLYDPNRPQEAQIEASSRRWTRNALFGGAAVILIVLGGYMAWFASRLNPIEQE
jgi:Protein of unknown function (DUF3592)